MKLLPAFFLLLLFTAPPVLRAQNAPRLLGAYQLNTGPADGPITAFTVYEVWGTTAPDHKDDALLAAVRAKLGGADNPSGLFWSGFSCNGGGQVARNHLNKKLQKKIRDSCGGSFLLANDARTIWETSSVVGNPPWASVASNTSSTKSSGGIEHSTADMSQFKAAFLGCLAFKYSSMSYLYVVPVYGPGFSKEKDAPAIARRYDMATSYHTYQWFAGRGASSIEKEFGRSMIVRLLEPYTVEQ